MQQPSAQSTTSTIFATAEATKAYADRMWAENPKLSPDGWRMIEDLTVAKIGIGTYRMDGRDRQPQALEQALLSGLNLIDTSANYMDGGAEVFIGQTLTRLFETGKLKREEVVLVTKAGYIQGQTLAQYKDIPPEETTFINDQLWHCIHPTFLDQQLKQSCERLGVDGVDVFLLHNPEYFLMAATQDAEDKIDVELARDAFYKRLQYAFTYLEILCQQEKIQYYGLSANTLVAGSDEPHFVDLQRVHEAAQAAAQEAWGRRKRPMLRVVQLPYNLIEVGALANVNTHAKTFDNAEPATTLELASRMHLAVLANRPLNAFTPSGRAFRLADGKNEGDLQKACATLVEAEKQLPELGNMPKLSILAPQLHAQLQGSLHFDHIKMTVLTPLLLETLHFANLPQAQAGAFFEAYQAVVTILRDHARTVDSKNNKALAEHLRAKLKQPTTPLQQIALNVVPSTPGVTAALCGLRSPEYVADAIAVLEAGDFADVGKVLLEETEVA